MEHSCATKRSSERHSLAGLIRKIIGLEWTAPQPPVPASNETAAGYTEMVERQYPIRIKLVIPAGGLGSRLDRIHDWLNQTCGADGWVIVAVGDGKDRMMALYLVDPEHAGAFVARWCTTRRIGAAEGAFEIRGHEAPTLTLLGGRQKDHLRAEQVFLSAA